jgi:chromosome segregation ATPase
MSTLATIGGYLGSTVFGGIIIKAIDAWTARGTDRSKRAEVSASADATVKTKRIDDAAALRGELWERIEKLEVKQEQCSKENADLKVAIGSRDSAINLLTSEVGKLRAELADARLALTRAREQTEAAEKMCRALATELELQHGKPSSERESAA